MDLLGMTLVLAVGAVTRYRGVFSFTKMCSLVAYPSIIEKDGIGNYHLFYYTFV